MFNATRFKTLMLREWLQNRWTWLIVVALLPVLAIVTVPFGQTDFEGKNPPEALIAAGAMALTALVCTLAAWATVLFMATGLARRDVQDRSIEFWLSLPSTHGEHIGAQYLMHALVFPLGAMAAGLLFGGLISPMMMVKWQGLGGLSAVNWGAVLAWVLQLALLGAVSLVLMALWLSPLVMLLMAASAWLKRLALPVLVLLMVFLGNFPATAQAFKAAMKSYGQPIGQLLEGLFKVFVGLLGPLADGEEKIAAMTLGEQVQTALGNLATPQFAVAIVIALLGAWMLALRRARGG